MSTAIFIAMVSAMGTLSNDAQGLLNGWLSEPVLEPGTTLREVEAFILKRIPPLEVPGSAREWEKQRATLRDRMLNEVVYLGVPSEWYEGPVRVEWTGRIDTGKGYQILKLRYEAVPGLWIPALLYEPDSLPGKTPAILNVNGHVGVPGKSIEYEQIRCINLAKRGVLALHPEWLSFGELGNPDYRHNDSAYLDLCGVSGLSVFYLAMKRGLDVLAEHPSADPARLGMTGLSGGGWQTILLSSLDPRISLCAPNAGYIGIGVRVHFQLDIGDQEQAPIDMLTVADYTHLTAMLAPRPALLIYNAQDECCFVADRAWPSVYAPIVPIYQLFGEEAKFQRHENADPGTHNYDVDNRLSFYRFVSEQWGLGWDGQELAYDGEIQTPEALAAGVPESNETFRSLALKQMEDLPVRDVTGADARRSLLAQALRWEPVPAEPHLVKETQGSGLVERIFALKTASWSIPVVSIQKDGAAPSATCLVLCDEGKAKLSEQTAALLEEGLRVVALDPLFIGECVPVANQPWQLAFLINATGARLLGEQVKQLTAAVRWAHEEFAGAPIQVRAQGPNSAVVALALGALLPGEIEKVRIDRAPASFRDLIVNRTRYEDCPALFCFGLVKRFDMDDLKALCVPYQDQVPP